jgi:hypothetical protein
MRALSVAVASVVACACLTLAPAGALAGTGKKILRKTSQISAQVAALQSEASALREQVGDLGGDQREQLSALQAELAALREYMGVLDQAQSQELSAQLDVLGASLDSLATIVESAGGGGEAVDLGPIQEAVERSEARLDLMSRTLEVTAHVNTESCASIPVQCGQSGSGHSFEPATSANHNPVLLTLYASSLGEGVSGLTIDDIRVDVPFVPAGGAIARKCSEEACGGSRFGGARGAYRVYLDTIASKWKAGTYTTVVGVSFQEGGQEFVGSTMVHFTIPRAADSSNGPVLEPEPVPIGPLPLPTPIIR